MPLDAPRLDERRFDDLVADLRQRIPQFAPEWTDLNASDPGITLLELFAWLTELQLYEINRLPEANLIRFLRLLGFEPEPPRPANAHVTFTTTPEAPVVGPVERGWQVSAQADDGGPPIIFEAEAGMDLVRMPLVSVQAFDGLAFRDVTAANDDDGIAFLPFGSAASPGSALYLGFDGEKLPAGARPFPSEVALRVLLPPADARSPRPLAVGSWEAPAPVELWWEYRAKSTATSWTRLDAFQDTTLGLSREGDIRFAGPGKLEPTTEGTDERKLYWLRCRLIAGRYPTGHRPSLERILTNTLAVTNLVTVSDELVGESDGSPDQSFALERRPAVDVTVEVRTPGAIPPAETWRRVDDLLIAGPRDPSYVVHGARGELQFGDGRSGRIPVAGAQIVATSYRSGGGARGNVRAGELNAPLSMPPGVQEVTNLRPAVGGRNEQAVQDLARGAPGALRAGQRAVATADYVALAKGAGIVNATAVPLLHPDYPGIEVPGAVTVAVVPDQHDSPPIPSDELLESVARRLEPCRVVTTEVYVRAPTYVPIRVEARVLAEPRAALDDVHHRVIKALDAFLDPRCREFAKDVHPSALYAVILGEHDVTAVDHVHVYVGDREHTPFEEPIVIPPDGLAYGAPGHVISVVRSDDR